MRDTYMFSAREQVARKGFHDGLNGNEWMFNRGFDPRYDAAYLAGERVRKHERKTASNRKVA